MSQRLQNVAVPTGIEICGGGSPAAFQSQRTVSEVRITRRLPEFQSKLDHSGGSAVALLWGFHWRCSRNNATTRRGPVMAGTSNQQILFGQGRSVCPQSDIELRPADPEK
jgi:hypothetical protein